MAEPITETDIAELVAQVDEAADAIMAGDIDRYLALISHADDYTLMNPAGGPVILKVAATPESRAAMAQMFRSGSAKLELVETYASGDLVVLVAIERQQGVVGDLPKQDWSLRVTSVFRRTDSGWELAHRHADPLVHPINAEQLPALALG